MVTYDPADPSGSSIVAAKGILAPAFAKSSLAPTGDKNLN